MLKVIRSILFLDVCISQNDIRIYLHTQLHTLSDWAKRADLADHGPNWRGDPKQLWYRPTGPSLKSRLFFRPKGYLGSINWSCIRKHKVTKGVFTAWLKLFLKNKEQEKKKKLAGWLKHDIETLSP